MSTRERAKSILTGVAWLIPAAIALALGDLHKMFILAVSGAVVLTLGRIIAVTTKRSTEIVATALSEVKTAVDEFKTAQANSPIPVPVPVVHQIGFKQGWEARERQTLDGMSDLVKVFEKYFPTPPN